MDTASPYTYVLPEDRIAQRPVYPPESAKMLVASVKTGSIANSTFFNVGEYLRPGDYLIFNDTKVLPARLLGRLDDQFGSLVEVVLIDEVAKSTWDVIGYPMKKIRKAKTLYFNELLSAEIARSSSSDRIRLNFIAAPNRAVGDLINLHGSMPIPPYIRNGRGDDQDRVDYQSIFAVHPGSVAAPTASLHFSRELVAELERSRGCVVDRITLHVGAASFQPVIVDNQLRAPGEERFLVSPSVLGRAAETKRKGGRVIAVGTTVVRALESAARSGQLSSKEGCTGLFIRPGFEFKVIDGLITNFHQPGTTHLLLVEALMGKEFLHRVYQEALSSEYRFLSYGDGMFIS